MYNPFFKHFLFIISFFIIYSCTLPLIVNEEILTKEEKKDVSKKEDQEVSKKEDQEVSKKEDQKELIIEPVYIDQNNNKKIISEIEIILPSEHNLEITKNFINALELSIYKKNIKNLSLNINRYSNNKELYKIIEKNIEPGKIFVGPLTSNDTMNINDYCSSGVIFFSFASDRKLASDCIYLINFFPEDDLQTLFDYFDSNVRLALLYPENIYGYYINNIIDDIAINSNVIIVNKSSYREDITNARDAIKQLGKYELRKHELERQKKILQNKNDEISKRTLKKIEKFETIGELDFTHILIADYNIRLLEIAPLLPFYDIDPNKIQFVGTGAWDDDAFFDEPSLQKAIFPGIQKNKRKDFIAEYIDAYKSEPIRISTIMYDLVGLLSYIINNRHTLESTLTLLNNHRLSFEGIDGKFSFENNLIKRELNILKIDNGNTILVE